MYGINLSSTDVFHAITTITSGTQGVLSAFLFDEYGIGIAAAKQDGGGYLLNITPDYTGLHYLAVAQGHDLEPSALIDPTHNGTARIFTTKTSFGYYVPGGPAANLPVSAWGGTVSGNPRTYSIALHGASLVPVSPVPAPPALLLFGTGIIGLIGFSRRRKAT